ncbi:MAG: hypothetical protein WA184_19080, partial [Stellaceae bacterium]
KQRICAALHVWPSNRHLAASRLPLFTERYRGYEPAAAAPRFDIVGAPPQRFLISQADGSLGAHDTGRRTPRNTFALDKGSNRRLVFAARHVLAPGPLGHFRDG